MEHGHHLTDRAAHRCADDMRRRHTGMIQHGDGIVGHLLDRVHAERLVAASCAAVVERNHPVVTRQREALHVPTVLVGTEALNHQHRGSAAPAECLVVKTSAVGGAGVRHQPSANQSMGATPVCRPPRPSIIRWMWRCVSSASSSSASGPRRLRRGRTCGPTSTRAARPNGVLIDATGNTGVPVTTALPISAGSTGPAWRGSRVPVPRR